MTGQSQEARLLEDNPINKVRRLLIMQMYYNNNFVMRRAHLHPDIIVGYVGDRGSGKSMSAGYTAMRDFLLPGGRVWSNLKIKITFTLQDEFVYYACRELCITYHKSFAGPVICESLPLDIRRYLDMDDEYHDGAFLIDEYNIAVADARRAMSNQNLESNDIGQQLRKLRSGLIYTCIHEMFVDNRVRDMTDSYIRCKDMALTPEGLQHEKPQGVDVQWLIYPMTNKLTGWSYNDTGSFITSYFKADTYWGIVDTYKKQERKKYTGPKGQVEITAEIEKDKNTEKWRWLSESPVLREIIESGDEVKNDDLYATMIDEMPADQNIDQKEFTDFIINAFAARHRRSNGKVVLRWDKTSLELMGRRGRVAEKHGVGSI
jgi:hypothetical protein